MGTYISSISVFTFPSWCFIQKINVCERTSDQKLNLENNDRTFERNNNLSTSLNFESQSINAKTYISLIVVLAMVGLNI